MDDQFCIQDSGFDSPRSNKADGTCMRDNETASKIDAFEHWNFRGWGEQQHELYNRRVFRRVTTLM